MDGFIFKFLAAVFYPKNLASVQKILLYPTQWAAAPSVPGLYANDLFGSSRNLKKILRVD